MEEVRNQLLDHLHSDIYCRIGVSKIHGVGVIAIKDIPKGINPFKLPGDNCNDFEIIAVKYGCLKNLPKGVKKIIDDFLSKKKIDQCNDNDLAWIPKKGLNILNVSFYMNHSQNNNINIIAENCIFHTFYTNRLIKKGEELTINYTHFK